MDARTRAAGDMSFGAIREKVCDAVCKAEGAGFRCYVGEMYQDSVVYTSCGPDNVEKMYQRAYSMVDGKVVLGDAVEVEREVSYVPIKAAAEIVGDEGDGGTGTVWRVRVIAFGPDKNGKICWDKAPLVAALPLFDGAKIFALKHSQHHDTKSMPRYGKPVTEMVGALSSPEVKADGIYSKLVILPSAAWLQNDLKACKERGIPYAYGLSVDIGGSTVKKMVAGKTMQAPKVISKVEVDVVHDPVGKGEFLEQLAAAQEAGQKEEYMFDKLMAALKGKRPDLHAQIEAGLTAGSMTEAEAFNLVAANMIGGHAGGDQTQMVAAMVAGMKDLLGSESGNEVKLLACSMTLDRQLLAAKLPPKMEASLRSRFGNTVFKDEELISQIQAAKEICDELTGSGNVVGMGGNRVVLEPTEKLQAASDMMFGLQVEDTVKDVKPFKSLRAAYCEITGDSEVRGHIDDQSQLRHLRAAGFDSSTFAFVLGNTLYRRMITDYQEMTDYGVSLVVGGNIRNARDFRSIQSVRIAYFGDLPSVNPEANTPGYTDLGTLGDEKVDYTLGQKGGIITISRRMIINDDIRAVETIRRRLPRAARRTLAKAVWNLLIANAVYLGDNKAVFHVDHNNLDTLVFGMAAVQAMKTRMYNQTEPGSGAVLGLDLQTLVIPEALWGAAVTLNQTPNFLIANVTTGNPFFHFFGANNERIHVNPFMTDATDFMAIGDPNQAEIVELAFLNGQQEPEMFIADNPNFGQFFVNDQIQYKIRHEYAAVLTDYRNVQKNVVVG
jgi:hypothetical protein